MVRPEVDEYQRDAKMILDKLDRLENGQTEVDKRLRLIETEIAMQRVKSSLWGGIAGVISFAATYALQYLQRGGGGK